jgi:hypothetical protein
LDQLGLDRTKRKGKVTQCGQNFFERTKIKMESGLKIRKLETTNVESRKIDQLIAGTTL